MPPADLVWVCYLNNKLTELAVLKTSWDCWFVFSFKSADVFCEWFRGSLKTRGEFAGCGEAWTSACSVNELNSKFGKLGSFSSKGVALGTGLPSWKETGCWISSGL